MSIPWTGLLLLPTLWVLISIYQAVVLAYDQKLRLIPGPLLNSFTTIPLKLQVLGGHRTAYIHSLHSKYGAVVRIGPNEVDFADLNSYREIHRIGSGFVKSKWYQSNMVGGHLDSDDNAGIFEMIDPKRYAAIRKQYAPAFTPAALQQWEPTVLRKVKQTVTRIRREASLGEADVFKWWGLMTFDIITSLAFGEEFDLVAEGKKSQAAHDIDNLLTIGGVNQELPFLWPFLQLLSSFIPKVRHFTNFYDRLEAYGKLAIKNAREGAESGDGHQTMFAKMIAESEDKDKMTSVSLDVIADRAMGLTIGGSDTTAITLTYLIWLVLTHQSARDKLLAEIEDLSEDAPASTLLKLPYLNNAIDEALRLYPAAPGSLYRVVPPHGARLAGYELPGRTAVNTQAWTFHRNPEYFVEPLLYNPDRWSDPTPEMKEAFMPFGGSSRQCIGLHLARMEMLYTTFRFFKACPNAKMVTKDSEMEPFDYFLMKPKGEKCFITTKQ